jgi:site-specific recombinase XerD
MVYFKVLLDDKRPKADNIYPVVVRVTHNRNNTSFVTGIRVNSSSWDALASKVKSSHPNAQTYNKTIAEFYSKVQNQSYQLVNEGNFTFADLKERMSDGYTAVTISKPKCFNDFAQQLIENLIETNKAGNAMVYKVAVKRFNAYVNNPKLKFADIDYNLLDGFKRQLLKDGVKQNTISNYFRTIRAVYNKAIKSKLVDRSRYPFLDIPIKTERTAKRAITTDELIKIANIELKPKSQKWHARNYFFLSFALIGASFTDLAYLTSANVKKGRLTYKRRKTGKELNIKLHPYAEKIFFHYKGMSTKYLLPILPANTVEDSMRAKALLMQAIKLTNKYLERIVEDCELDCEVTTYVARHSWATTAKRLGFSIELIAEAMGHEYGNKITNIYLDNFDQSVIDEANAKVISCIE